MQYQTKLSPSYPQSYPQKGAIHCKTCSTTCKIRSIKQSYPQVIHRVIPKKVLQHAKYAVPPAKYIVPHMQNTQYPMQNTQYPMQNTQYPMQNMQYPLQNMQYPLQNTQYPMQNMQYQTKLSPSYPQSYPQWICRRKMDLKSKSKCFILT